MNYPKNKPKISIIIPFYNVEPYVKRCLNSLTNQTFSDIEILCINDGSTDNTLEVLKSSSTSDDRIKIITQQNKGVSAARNTGIKNAKGEFLLFIDGDDYIELNSCELLYQKALETDADMICFWRKYIYDNKKEKNPLPKNISALNKVYKFNDNISGTFKDLFGCFMCDRLYKKSFLTDNNIYFNEDLCWREDNIFVYKCCFANPKILITDYTLYNYWISTNNSLSKITGERRIKRIMDNLNCVNDICSRCDNISKLYIIDSFLLALSCGTFFRSLYESSRKRECLNAILQLLKPFDGLGEGYLQNMNGYRKFYIYYLFLIKFHLGYIYSFVLYPILKLLKKFAISFL